MSYENAPATDMLATACACCGRPLLDAISVEAGVGPDCRERYGYGEAQGAPDWALAASFLAAAAAERVRPLPATAAWGADARGVANVLVRAFATADVAPGARVRCVAALAALGFGKLARKLLARAGGILVEDAGEGVLRVKTPFSPAFNDAMRRVAGQRWVEAEKARHVPASSRIALWTALSSAFPGALVSGPKGLRIL